MELFEKLFRSKYRWIGLLVAVAGLGAVAFSENLGGAPTSALVAWALGCVGFIVLAAGIEGGGGADLSGAVRDASQGRTPARPAGCAARGGAALRPALGRRRQDRQRRARAHARPRRRGRAPAQGGQPRVEPRGRGRPRAGGRARARARPGQGRDHHDRVAARHREGRPRGREEEARPEPHAHQGGGRPRRRSGHQALGRLRRADGGGRADHRLDAGDQRRAPPDRAARRGARLERRGEQRARSSR